MEIKAQLNKPYTESQKVDFIIENNHKKGYEIRETEEALEAWGNTDAEFLEQAKTAKYTEALTKAYTFLGSGDAYYELREGITFEASDSNISKLTSCMLDLGRQEAFADAGDDITKIIENVINIFKGRISGKTIKWTTREDVLIDLNVLEIVKILKGIEAIQLRVWSVKYPEYIKRIKNAETEKDINSIIIEY